MSKFVTSENSFGEPICNNCRHWFKGTLSCKAFVKIPVEILSGTDDHANRLPSQKNDFVFEALSEKEKIERKLK